MKAIAKFLGDAIPDVKVAATGEGPLIIDRIFVTTDSPLPLRCAVLDRDEQDGFDHIVHDVLRYDGPLEIPCEPTSENNYDIVIRRPTSLPQNYFCIVEVDYHRE